MSEEDKSKNNPHNLGSRVSILETKVNTVEDAIKLLMDPTKGVFVQLQDIKNALKFWPKLIGVVVSFLTFVVTAVEILKLGGVIP